MIDESAFSQEPAPEPVTPEVEPPDPLETTKPVIVIEYRQRGWLGRLLPPVLLVLFAIAVSSYQRVTPVRPVRLDYAPHVNVPKPPPRLTPKTEPVIVRAATTDEVQAATNEGDKSKESEVLTPAPAPSRPAPSAVVVQPEPPASPFDLDPIDGLVPIASPPNAKPEPLTDDPLGSVVVADAKTASGGEASPSLEPERVDPRSEATEEPAAAEVSREDVMRDIEREAVAKEARKQELEDLKPRARSLLLAEALGRTHSARIPFRNDLREALRTFGDNAGPEIERLCNQYGREPLPEVRNAYDRKKRSMPQRASRAAEVEMMRSIGLPEPVILDFLAHMLHKTINTRGGPRDANEVRIRAARQLLSYPVTTTRPPSAPSVIGPAEASVFNRPARGEVRQP